MRSKPLQRSAWLPLLVALVLMGIMSGGATADPNNATLLKPSTGSTVALRLKVAIEALFEPLGLRGAPNRRRLPSESEYMELGPLE
jgi:hypothetical protein